MLFATIHGRSPSCLVNPSTAEIFAVNSHSVAAARFRGYRVVVAVMVRAARVMGASVSNEKVCGTRKSEAVTKNNKTGSACDISSVATFYMK
jgi:hypothetical protein